MKNAVIQLVDKHASPQTSSFFSGISDDERRNILASAQHKKISAGTVIIRGGEPASHLFLLNAGRAKYYRLTSEGEEVLLWSVAKGDVFGLGTLLKQPISYIGSAEALQECELYVWDHEKIRYLAKVYPQLAENSMRIVLHYLSDHAQRLVDIVTENAEQRVARALLRVGDTSGHAVRNGIDVDVTNEHLSALANVSPFTASRVISKWGRCGAVTKKRGHILIHTPEKLIDT
jgi:CRP/FNR family transcriptional regulator, nitrogen oxide reductase regulator